MPWALPRALEVRPSCTEQHRLARMLRAAVPQGAPRLPVFTCLPLPCFNLLTTPFCHVWMEATGSLRGGVLTLTSGWTLAPDKLGPGYTVYRRQENGTCPCPRVMMLQTSKEMTHGPASIPDTGTEHCRCDGCHPRGSRVCPVLGILTS